MYLQGFAFVRFCDPISATSALSALPGAVLHGRSLRASEVDHGPEVDTKKGKRSADEVEDIFDAADAFDVSAAVEEALAEAGYSGSHDTEPEKVEPA